MPSERIGGSYRDPSGYVFRRDELIFRAIDNTCRAALTPWDRDGTIAGIDGLIGTQFVNDKHLIEQLTAEHDGYQHFLQHDVLEQISYPYEWTLSMLADAGVLTLDIQLQLLSECLSLKDATPYNVQFVNGRPVFIDVSSIEMPRRLDVWHAMGQFLQMFIYPAMLFRMQGWDFRAFFLSNMNGRSIEEVAQSLGFWSKLRPQMLMDVTLPLWLHRWSERKHKRVSKNASPSNPERITRPSASKEPTGKADAQRLNLHRLRKKLNRLADGHKPRGVWSDYTETCTYSVEAETAKKRLVEQFLLQHRPASVLDVGCNTGDYSRLAASTGADVIAMDSDHDVVDILYREVRGRETRITPMVMDICNPSPAIGFLNRERDAFLDRVCVDCVLALALLHHLLVSGNLPLTHIVQLMARLTNRDLILEFVPREDPMFEKLMQFREELYDHANLETVKACFLQQFELLEEHAIPHSGRTLLMLRKRN